MHNPEAFWAADIGEGWEKCASKDTALARSAEHLRKPHAMLMRRMKLSELLEMRASEVMRGGYEVAVALCESDGDVEYTFGHEGNPLGEDIGEDELCEIVQVGLLAMMSEADSRGLTVGGCIKLEDVYGNEAATED